MTNRSSLTSGAAAFAAVVVVVVVWWLLSGNGPQGPAGNADRMVQPSGAPSAAPGSPTGRVAEPPPARKDTVRIQGFTAGPGTALTLHYATGPTGCYGRIDTPRVVETDAAVTVTLRLVPPPGRPRDPCPDLAKLLSVRVELDAPLGSRSLLDGGYDEPVLVEPGPSAW